jgi:hypothetical protein
VHHLYSCVLIRYKNRPFLPPRQRLDLTRLLLERCHQRSQIDQGLDRQRSFPRRLTQASPGNWQPDRAQRPAFTHIQAAFGALAFEQDGQPLAIQRVERVSDDQPTGRRPVRPRTMR